MLPSCKARLIYNLLFSFLSIIFIIAPAQAVTTYYEFTATVFLNYAGQEKTFSFQYADAGNGAVSLSEIDQSKFSGAWVLTSGAGPGGSADWVFYPYVTGVPQHDPTYYPLLDGTDPYWYFGLSPGVTAIGVGPWAYSYSQVPVPIPPSALLLATALMPLAWARRKKRLGK
jgi:hypothetical protein